MFSLTMCFLFASGIQRKYKIFKMKPLGGAIEVPEIKKPNFKNYYDFSFQRSVEKNLELTFGFREPLIRVYNQYTWDFYNSHHTKEVLIGKSDWLYPRWHLLVPKYSPELSERFDQQALYFYLLSDILKEYNTQLLVCFIPSKIDIYKEYMPYDTCKFYDFNPIDYFCEKFDESGVNYINFTKMFYDIKDNAVFNPFSQAGAHWSNIASAYAADSIFKRFSTLSDVNMPKLKFGEPYPAKTRNPDDDLEWLLNLYRPLKSLPNYYVDIEVVEDSTSTYPKMITIGDSHFWNIVDNVPLNKIFVENPYWYYAKSIYFDKNYHHVDQVNIAEEFISSDYLLFLYNAYQTYDIDSDIILRGITSLGEEDNAALYDKFYNSDGTRKVVILSEEEKTEKRILEIMNGMRTSEEWMESLKKKAKTKNKTLEEVMREDAIWLIQEEKEEKTNEN